MKKTLFNKYLFQLNKKNFSALPKVPKMEVSMRTPYKSYFNNFNGFTNVYLNTLKGQIAVSNRTYPQIYVLPPGEIRFTGLSKGQGNETDNTSGEFIHAGGHAIIHP